MSIPKRIARPSGILLALSLLATVFTSLGLSTSQAHAAVSVKLEGSKYYTWWLYKEGLVAARVKVAIRDPRHKAVELNVCGISPAGRKCRVRPLLASWRTSDGWYGVLVYRSGWTGTAWCAELDEQRYHVAIRVQVFDRRGREMDRARHDMIQRCAVAR